MTSPRIIDRYALFDEIAAGGMGVVHIGRLVGSQGFARIVAVKRLHPNLAKDPEFVDMFVDEARLAARIRHPNVVVTLDVVEGDGEVLVVMEYIHGATLAKVQRMLRDRGERVPHDVAVAIMHGALQGLHAAHEATTEHGALLGLVHRDVSPQNIMVGADGVPRVLDFGVAKAAWRAVTTRDGQVKGKLTYMAPEQISGADIDRRVDVYAAGIVFWEMLTGKKLFEGDNPGRITTAVLAGAKDPPSKHAPDVPAELDAIVMKALSLDASTRFQNALEMAIALERAAPIATTRRVGEWLTSLAKDALDARARYVADVESKESLSSPGIRVVPDEPATKLVATPVPAPTNEIGSVSNAVLTRDSVSAIEQRPPRSRMPVMIAAIGAFVMLAVAGVLLIRAAHDAREKTAAAATNVSTNAPAAEPPPNAPVAEPAAALTPAPALAPTPTQAPAPTQVTPTQATTPSKTNAQRPSTGPSKPAVAKPASAPAAAAKCDPPYTVDAKGVRVPKRECF